MGGATGLLNEHDYVPTQQGGPPTNNTNPAGDGYAPGAQLPATSLGGDLAPGYSAYADGRGPVAGFDPVMISLIRRSMPNLIAYDICGVQPMSGPTGLIFAMRSMYDGPLGPNEAFFDEPDPTFSAGYGLPRNGQMSDGAPYEGSNDPRATMVTTTSNLMVHVMMVLLMTTFLVSTLTPTVRMVTLVSTLKK